MQHKQVLEYVFIRKAQVARTSMPTHTANVLSRCVLNVAGCVLPATPGGLWQGPLREVGACSRELRRPARLPAEISLDTLALQITLEPASNRESLDRRCSEEDHCTPGLLQAPVKDLDPGHRDREHNNRQGDIGPASSESDHEQISNSGTVHFSLFAVQL